MCKITKESIQGLQVPWLKERAHDYMINESLKRAFKESREEVAYLTELLLQFIPTPDLEFPTGDIITIVPTPIVKEAHEYYRKRLNLE